MCMMIGWKRLDSKEVKCSECGKGTGVYLVAHNRIAVEIQSFVDEFNQFYKTEYDRKVSRTARRGKPTDGLLLEKYDILCNACNSKAIRNELMRSISAIHARQRKKENIHS
jgi:hypothetical protein